MSAQIYQILDGTPQAIFPDGLQEDFLVTNTGITSVYLDSDSSIGLTSYRLRPLASLVWSGTKPLWALSGKPPTYRGATYLDNIEAISSAQITVNRNNQNASTISSSYTQPIASIPAFVGSGDTLIRFDNLEVGHLETVVISFRTPNLSPWSAAKLITADIGWYGDEVDTIPLGAAFAVQRVMSWYPDAGVTSRFTLTIPVRAARMAIDIQAEDAVITALSDVRVYGRSAKTKLQVSGLWTNAIAFSPTLLIPLTAEDDIISWLSGTYDFAPIYMMAKSSTIRISLRTHAAVTVAGTLLLVANGIWYGTMTIPVGPANAVITQEFTVPLSAYLQLSAPTVPTPAPTGANYSLSILMKDGATL